LLGETLTSNEEFYIPCSRVLEKEARRDFYKSINDPLVKLVFKCQYIGESIREAGEWLKYKKVLSGSN